jgi:inorganic pyrophosphatase
MVSVVICELFIFLSAIISLLFGAYNWWAVASIEVTLGGEETGINEAMLETQKKREEEMIRVSGIIADGAKTFLFQEYVYLVIFMICFAIIIALVAEYKLGTFWTTCSFITGFTTSILSGYIGMRIAVIANVRTTKEASISLHRGFVTAF